MSGFGNEGAFGGPQQPSFGQTPQPQPQPQLQQGFGRVGGFGSSQLPQSFSGSSFGNAATGFGFGTHAQAASGTPSFGGNISTNNFGPTQSSTPFQPPALTAFGTSFPIPFDTGAPPQAFEISSVAKFGASTPSFGAPLGMTATSASFIPSSFGSATTMSTVPPPNSFGNPVQTSSSQPNFPSFGGNHASTGFHPTPFGAPAVGAGFGITASSGFGANSTFSSNIPLTVGLATTHTAGAPFKASPFGSSTISSPAMVFGTSSTIAPTATQISFPGQDFGSVNATKAALIPSHFGGGTSFGGPVPSALSATTSGPSVIRAFASPAPAAHFDHSTSFAATSTGFRTTPFGKVQDQQIHDESMGDGGSTWDTSTDAGMSTTRTPFGQLPSVPFGQAPALTMTTIPEQTMMQEASMTESTDDKKVHEDKLAALKKKLAEKRKKLEEHKQRKQTSTTPLLALSTSASPLETTSPESPKSSLAERNTHRFAQKPISTTRSQLPVDPVARSVIKKSTGLSTQEEKLHTQLDLEDAVALIGICPYMCPDHELKQREQEGDIQLLEIPQPGTIHPPDWNLRHTAVKRFRRSAADYKLDIPEWVRPPHVLERTCAYLEEWVMERDRQGPDPRFTQAPSPPPLDVYQFIWDRTRMIRKDFILQNFVGSRGHCDARAVRCHERIARWHAMCEHQLSHIPDFVRMQSQQNIAELGQAMKTLNQFYDDFLGRSTVEVPDEHGIETVTDLNGQTFGCCSEIVNGVSPVDYDGTPLINDEKKIILAKRLIGAHAANTTMNTTAEPEMRALYILLTLDNDGGMEVLSYASELSRRRPEIFRSRPVQLAMDVFKAKHEVNYARFFAILRSSSTPYLFACLMFKHVEEMRKVALRIMCATYGYRRKDADPIYDHYPLKYLSRLLCFESIAEARVACAHYNITVKEQDVLSSSSPTGKKSVELVFWKRSKFREPIDEEKKIIIPLRPWKMVITIEGKLKGATRLAVCRGEVSGQDSALRKRGVSLPASSSREEKQRHIQLEEKARSIAIRMDEERQNAHTRQEMLKLEQEDADNFKEADRKATELRQLEMDRLKAEVTKRNKLLSLVQHEEEINRIKAIEDENRRKELKRHREEAEAARVHAMAAAENDKRRQELLESRLAVEKEQVRKAAEVEARRHEDEVRKLEEKTLRIFEEKKAREEEIRKVRLFELQKMRENEDKKRQEVEEQHKWAGKIVIARKTLLWRRLRQILGSRLRQSRTRQTLSRMTTIIGTPFSNAIKLTDDVVGNCASFSGSVDGLFITDFLELLSRQECREIDICSLLNDVKCRLPVASSSPKQTFLNDQRSLVLLKVAVVIPRLFKNDTSETEAIYDLLHEWIGKRLAYGKIHSTIITFSFQFEVRIAIVNGANPDTLGDTDFALVVIPPGPMNLEMSKMDNSCNLSGIGRGMPIIVLNLDNRSNQRYSTGVERIVASSSALATVNLVGDELCDFEESLMTATALMIKSASIFEDTIRVHATCIYEIVVVVMKQTLWMGTSISPEQVLDLARATLLGILSELEKLATIFRSSQWLAWPPQEFTQGGVVKDYFGRGCDLPLCWYESLTRNNVEATVMNLHSILQSSFDEAIMNLLSEAPDKVKSEFKSMIAAEQFQRCLDCAFQWWGEFEASRKGCHIFLLAGMVDHIVEGCVQYLGLTDDEFIEAFPEKMNSISESSKGDHSLPLNILRMNTGLEHDDESGKWESEQDWQHGKLIHQMPTAQNKPSLISDVPLLSLEITPDEHAFLIRSKRALENVAKLRAESDHKRKREEYISLEVRESRAFTEKLESMLHGNTTCDVRVGQSLLSRLLLSVPPIDLPSDRSSVESGLLT